MSARSVAPKAAAEVSLALVGVSALIRGQHGIDANLFLRARRRRRRPPMWRKRYSLISEGFSRARPARAGFQSGLSTAKPVQCPEMGFDIVVPRYRNSPTRGHSGQTLVRAAYAVSPGKDRRRLFFRT